MAAYNPNAIWEGKKKEEGNTPYSFEAPKEPKSVGSGPLGGPAVPGPAKMDDGGMRPPSFFKRHGLAIFSTALVLFLALGGFIVYVLRPPATPKVDITFASPEKVPVGVPFTLHVSLNNSSESILRGAELTVALPDGVSFVGESQGDRATDLQIGDISAGEIAAKDVDLIATANPQSVQHVNTKLLYGTDATAKTQFENDATADIVVGDPAIDLVFSSPANIFSGQKFDLAVTYTNNTSADLPGLTLALQYPPAFNFEKSTVPPQGAGKNIWTIGTLPAHATGTITVTGNIVGPDQGLYSVNGTIAAGFSGQSYSIATQSAGFQIASSPLSLSIVANGSPDAVANPGDPVTYTLTYKNNSTVTFQGVSIKATIVGVMFVPATLQSAGSFDSRANTVTWYAANTPGLAAVAPGQSGTVDFAVRTRGTYPTRLLSDKNYILKVNATIQSPTVPPNTAGNGTVFATSVQNKVAGKIVFGQTAYWKEPTAGIANAGPYPPKVDQATQYTVHWAVTSYSTDAQNISVSAYLQSGSTFTGKITSNVSSTPTYDPLTGLVTWTVPFVPATAGVISPPAEAVFQITNTPAINQVGQAVTLVGPATFRATDAFTGALTELKTSEITTSLPDDRSIGQNRGVTQ